MCQLGLMKILVTKVISVEGQDYLISPHCGLAEKSVSLSRFHSHQASSLITHLAS